MGLFNASLYRSFAVGFTLGAVGLFLTLGNSDDGVAGAVVGHALAAPANTD
ncbi:MAG: hypothetical protein V4579_07395 [Pseudomonadota bacterium]